MVKRMQRAADGRRLGTSTPTNTFSRTATATLDFASVAANTRGTGLTVTVSGARTGDFVRVMPASGAPANAGLKFEGFVTANDTVTVYPFNVTTGAIDPDSASYKVIVERAAV